MRAHPVDLVDLAAVGYRLRVDTALLAYRHYRKSPEELTAEECQQLTNILKREEERRNGEATTGGAGTTA